MKIIDTQKHCCKLWLDHWRIPQRSLLLLTSVAQAYKPLRLNQIRKEEGDESEQGTQVCESLENPSSKMTPKRMYGETWRDATHTGGSRKEELQR